MTTTALESQTPTDTLLAESQKTRAALQEARAAMPDALDLPRTLTQRQVDAHETRRAQYDAYIRALEGARISHADHLYQKRDYLEGLWAAIEQQVVPDVEDDRQRWLNDSLRALREGVRYWPNGVPMIPQPLRELMTTPPCALCGHQAEVKWLGTIPAMEEEIAAMEKRIKEERAHIEALLAGAAALLAEPVSS